MRLLLDENLDRRFKRFFDDAFEIMTVAERGWNGKKNGELLRLAESEFDVFMTMDTGLEYQQNIQSVGLAIIVIHANSNRLRDIEPAVSKIREVLKTIQNGTRVHVDAGGK